MAKESKNKIKKNIQWIIVIKYFIIKLLLLLFNMKFYLIIFFHIFIF